MIDNPDNGHNPEMRDKGLDPTKEPQMATAVAEPRVEKTQPSSADPWTSPQTATRTHEPAQEVPVGGDQPAAIAEPVRAPTELTGRAGFSSELTKFRQSFEQIQAEFIGEPRAAVEKAEKLIDGLMNALHDQLQHIHSNVKKDTDTEQLRVAMLSYRELLSSLGGRRAT